MNMFAKFFIYLAVIVMIAILNSADVAHAKSFTGISGLKKMNEPPQKPAQFESSFSRMRRDAHLRTASEDDIPKEPLSAGSRLRARRQAPHGESDIPQESEKRDTKLYRAKRQIPSPPGDIPMPPM